MRLNWRTLVALMALLAMVATACASDDADDDTADAAAVEETDEPAEAEPEEAEEPTEEPEEAAETEETDETEEPEAAGDGEIDYESLEADLLGAGASFPDPVYQAWIGEFTQNVAPGVSIQYEAIGSGGGREQFIGQQTDFGGSDAFMSDEEIEDAIEARGCGEVLHMPTVFGGVVVAYNIFSGEITNINDPAIAELNPDIELPDVPLTVTVRADGSGTTSIFTTYLEDEDEDWAAEYGSGDEVDWFGGEVAGEQNDGVAAAISQQPGAIGYLSLEFAVSAGLPFASVINADGNAVQPNTDTVGAAADAIEGLPDDLRFDTLGVGGEGYPIAGATWMLAYTCGYEENVADALKGYITWALTEGDDQAAELGYAPLSDDFQETVLEKVSRINEEG
jgi:phosphate transport system substrate-binding protein